MQLRKVVLLMLAFVVVGCDHETRVKVFVTGPDVTVAAPAASPAAPAIPSPVVIVDVAPADPLIVNLLYPPADDGVPFNDDPASVDLPCEKPGRGDGNGSPGRGKGQGDVRACR